MNFTREQSASLPVAEPSRPRHRDDNTEESRVVAAIQVLADDARALLAYAQRRFPGDGFDRLKDARAALKGVVTIMRHWELVRAREADNASHACRGEKENAS